MSTDKELPSPFRKAEKASLNSDHLKYKMGAAVYYGKGFLAAGFNSMKTNPITRKYRSLKTTHAEISALRKAKSKKKNLRGAEIYIFRKTTHGLAMSKPCEMCLNELKFEGIKKIYYTSETGIQILEVA